MPLPDYYKLLQLDRSASPEQVWLSYHKLKFLADKRKPEQDRQKLFELRRAYYILSDEALRQQYDLACNRRPLLGITWNLRRAALPFLIGLLAAILSFLAFGLK